ncbi:hypothetical protein [Geodermatophilus obscurus]|uniref:Uncharacterized protein n=1 Tax=Geodermatophilus obscurus (strain ATCC 25078 / DSM 43160 / JCM 3152 / CCUG 61914 / KCC A-0152 / KCTC 9177 / NBRC 13315 / NRRL B-3577 / G-20) TaxID=526225 RepID=D2S846_GEOOG|nr:hypothetical protein [Geodermatophilus obscurus]ADB73468.1 hypothetical protein Gobs_0691 [Geodermatophilus obscurus DSM 43160]
MSAPARRSDEDWVSLVDGVRVSRRWMTRHTPQLLAAWCAALSEVQRRTIAARILQVAADLESEPDDALAPPGRPVWRRAVERIGAHLVRGPDWLPLAAALARAHAAGYDVAARLPALAAAAPLPDRHPARELHWRLLEDCPAALPATDDSARADDDAAAVHSPSGRPQNRRDRPPHAP